MPNQNLTIEQFGAKVKESKPQYANMSDYDLGVAMLNKYPVYNSWLATGELDRLKKKETTHTQQQPQSTTTPPTNQL